ncbi:hypothetical protein SP15_255 [Bacillus phage SP-15]|uniref:Uncharacterized protein n=1 Tax=Bacillus phage SP-15 TaxID=1792032 RepID=A0A127AWU1_9CAUD|nr:hypothetical protein SP15_255 [Bacillus phage SP-15]AMM45062.1 hypothetical protein SP15_255 [Bacillus phage SP-15]
MIAKNNNAQDRDQKLLSDIMDSFRKLIRNFNVSVAGKLSSDVRKEFEKRVMNTLEDAVNQLAKWEAANESITKISFNEVTKLNNNTEHGLLSNVLDQLRNLKRDLNSKVLPELTSQARNLVSSKVIIHLDKAIESLEEWGTQLFDESEAVDFLEYDKLVELFLVKATFDGKAGQAGRNLLNLEKNIKEDLEVLHRLLKTSKTQGRGSLMKQYDELVNLFDTTFTDAAKIVRGIIKTYNKYNE